MSKVGIHTIPASVTTIAPAADLIRQRVRSGSLLLAAASVLGIALDVTARPGDLQPVAWTYGALFTLIILVQIATRDARIRTHAVPFAAAAVMLCNAVFCAYAVLSPGEIHTLVAPSIVIMTAAGVMLPWGMRPQAIVSAVCVLNYLGALELSNHHADLGTFYALVSLLGAAVVSCVGARMVEQHDRLVERHSRHLREMNRLMQEAGAKKDEFLASVSHELRTPLNVAVGYIELLLDNSFGQLELAQREILHRVTNSARSLSHLIDDLIDLTRIEAGRLRMEIGVVELSPLFADLSSMMGVLLEGHDVEFKANLAPGCPAVRADPNRIKQILSNLLANAAKFTERGSISLRADPQAGGRVAFSVSDTGIGIPVAAQRAIFEPFRQVHDRSKRVPGAGIGLSISLRLAHLMGGSLSVQSEPGRGSTMTLVLPAAACAADDRDDPTGPLESLVDGTCRLNLAVPATDRPKLVLSDLHEN